MMITKFYINKNKIIKVSLNDDKITKIIKIYNEERKIYSSKKYDITIIEIIQNDNINDVNYLIIDENIYKENSEIYLEGKTIYDLSYPNGNKSSVSYGIISQLDENNIYHLCNTDKGSSGSPLLNLENNKVIGIHKGESSHFEFNKGTLLYKPITEFIDENKSNDINNKKINNNKKNKETQLNEITMKINEPGKIYFLDNTTLHDNLKELNKTNVELYINNKKYNIIFQNFLLMILME